jgi:hypothetical protein
MQIERTPGTEMYRKATEAAMTGALPGTGPAQSAGSNPPRPGGSTGSGGVVPTCSCEEKEILEKQSAGLKAAAQAGEDVQMADIMALTRCHSVCQRQYMICEMERNEKNREAEKSKRQAAEAAAPCDCGCTALADLERRGTKLQTQFDPGDQQQMEELRYLSRCLNACRNELMDCRAQ